jgi:hypothetical protein
MMLVRGHKGLCEWWEGWQVDGQKQHHLQPFLAARLPSSSLR